MDLWQHFVIRMDTKTEQEKTFACHACEFATKTEKLEPRVDPERFPGLNESWYAPVDRSTYKPTAENAACQACFCSWVEEMKDEGRACIKCDSWLKKADMAMVIEAREAEGKHKGRIVSKRAVCVKCLTGGKSLDEWAKALVEKQKAHLTGAA